ncbi:hypothetical protein DFH27DRAFT_541917 [Peziza echinospora]|nr:hypothetical protein DFH27DRAFT_541917 [Peziza echinospora]
MGSFCVCVPRNIFFFAVGLVWRWTVAHYEYMGTMRIGPCSANATRYNSVVGAGGEKGPKYPYIRYNRDGKSVAFGARLLAFLNQWPPQQCNAHTNFSRSGSRRAKPGFGHASGRPL